MSKRPAQANEWFPLNCDAWRTKTRKMKPVERCAYMDLLVEYWDGQGPLEIDHDDFAQIVGVTRIEWDLIAVRVLRFFEERDGKIHNARMDREIKKANELLQRRREAGRKGGLKSRPTGEAKDKQSLSSASDLLPKNDEKTKQTVSEGEHTRGYRQNGVAESRSVQASPLQILNDDVELNAVISSIERTARGSLAGKDAARQRGSSAKLRGVS